MLGVPDALIPPTIDAFGRYVAGMVESDTLAVGPASREIAASILRPPLPIGIRQLAGTSALFTAGLLPAPLRERYGLGWDGAREAVLRATAVATRLAVPLLPGPVRFMPHARRAASQAR
jgi:uncharacterized protein (DUF2236 family)